MRRPPRIPVLRRRSTTTATTRRRLELDRPSFGFSGAGFLGCYHVGVVACLNRHGALPSLNDDDPRTSRDPRAAKMPLLTGVSAGSMIASSVLAGVDPEPDGMEVVLEAARRTRELSPSRRKKDSPYDPNGKEGESLKSGRPPGGLMETLGVSLDVLTPGFSLINAVEGPFRDALAKALGGCCEKDCTKNSFTFHDIDPELFASRFRVGTLRIGLTDRRELGRTMSLSKAYRFVDAYRDLEDVVACSMLSSYIPGGTGPLTSKDKVPNFVSGLMPNPKSTDVSDRAGLRLKEMARLGMVKHGRTGLPVVESEESKDDADEANEPTTYYWDGGLADMFPTFNDGTVIVSPLNGVYSPNPSICPRIPDVDNDAAIAGENRKDSESQGRWQQGNDREAPAAPSALQNYLRSYLPRTFRHCPKARLGLNSENAATVLRMALSSNDDELYLRFRDGYDDARRFLDQRGQLRVFSG